jgi:S-adenosylmethionine hydrolase
MIALFTDFGLDGLYVGQMHAVVNAALPAEKVIDLCHTIPPQDVRAAAYLLPAYTRYLPPATVIICVVDPGVGSQRPHAACEADGRWFVGPDNGLFDVLQQHAHSFRKYHFQWPGQVSNSFHARDIYTPAACLLVESAQPDVLQARQVEGAVTKFEPDINQVIYFDYFGNAITGYRFSSLAGESALQLNGLPLHPARTFSDVDECTAFWYENANGLIEIAVNQGSAQDKLGLQAGDTFTIHQL